MTKEWEYLVRLKPSMVRCGEPLTVHVEKAKLLPREDGLTLELYELDNFVYRPKGQKNWTVIEDEGKPFRPEKQERNPDDLIATFQGAIVLKKVGEEVHHYFVAKSVTLAERVQKSQKGKKLALETRYGRLIPIQFEGVKKVWDIPMPFDGNEEETRDGEGPRLELSVSLKRGGEVLYQGGIQTFVTDWRWWASTSFAPPRPNCSVDYFVDGKEYFERVSETIERAEKYIYITDWKLNPYAVLRRDAPPAEPEYPATAFNHKLAARPSSDWYRYAVGDLLIAAVKRGVKVYVLLWYSAQLADNVDDMTACYLMDQGVAVAAHNPAGEHNWSKLFWSHHQKTVMVDGKFAFVGGLDLAENRWETQDHRPFDYIADPNSGYLSGKGKHKDRFRCGGFDRDEFEAYAKQHDVDRVADKGAWSERHFKLRSDRAPLRRDRVPRMAWHDVHCEVRGPAVHDVERNFVQRWNRSAPQFLQRIEDAPTGNGEYFIKKKFMSIAFDPGPAFTRMLKARRMAEFCRHFEAVDWWTDLIGHKRHWGRFVEELRVKARALLKPLPDLPLATSPEGPGNDIVQVVRSLEAESIVPAPHIKVEKSIQEAYLRAIDNAEHYVYIESQMFLSKFVPGTPLASVWDEKKQGIIWNWEDIENQLAIRLADKVKRKIKAGVPFHVYIVLPEIYDGDPTVDANREIMLYQYITLGTLHHSIQDAAKAEGLDPDDYFSVYALRAAGTTTDGENRVRSNLVYVHSKLMIVDDVFLTMGSANANGRSMDGYRDTELNVVVVGERDMDVQMGHEPWRANRKIRNFRMRLWREHLGPLTLGDRLVNPSHPETIAWWRAKGLRNWQVFNELYEVEMKLLDFIDKELEIQRKENKKPGSHTAELQVLAREQLQLHGKSHELLKRLETQGHIIDHPYRSRGESKGEKFVFIPDTIPK